MTDEHKEAMRIGRENANLLRTKKAATDAKRLATRRANQLKKEASLNPAVTDLVVERGAVAPVEPGSAPDALQPSSPTPNGPFKGPHNIRYGEDGLEITIMIYAEMDPEERAAMLNLCAEPSSDTWDVLAAMKREQRLMTSGTTPYMLGDPDQHPADAMRDMDWPQFTATVAIPPEFLRVDLTFLKEIRDRLRNLKPDHNLILEPGDLPEVEALLKALGEI